MSKARFMAISTSGKIDDNGYPIIRNHIMSKAYEFQKKYNCVPVVLGTKEAINHMTPYGLQDDSDIVIDGLRFVVCEAIELTHGKIEMDNDILFISNL